MKLLELILSSSAIIGISFVVALAVKNGFKSTWIIVFLYVMSFDCMHMSFMITPWYNFFGIKFALLSFNTLLGFSLLIHSNILINTKFKLSPSFVIGVIGYLSLFLFLYITKVDTSNATYQFFKPSINLLFAFLAIYTLKSKQDTTDIDPKRIALAIEQNIIFGAICLIEVFVSLFSIAIESPKLYYHITYTLIFITIIYMGYSELYMKKSKYNILSLLSSNDTIPEVVSNIPKYVIDFENIVNIKDGTRISKATIKPVLNEERAKIVADKIIQFTKNNVGFHRNSKFRVSDLADMIGEKERHVSYALNNEMGYQFNDYVNSFRILEAIAILDDESNSDKIEFIAARVGFGSMKTFYDTFSKVIPDMCPLEYKKSRSCLNANN